MTTGAPVAEEVRAALEDLKGWPPIVRSPQLTGFLHYIVEKTLAGEEEGIKAYSIAVDVFGRPDSFDPQSDPIVRVQARRLRSLLDQYYREEGEGAVVRIALPVGRYVPTFEIRGAPGTSGAAGPAVEDVPARPLGSRFDLVFWSRLFVGFAILIAALVALLIYASGGHAG